MMTKPPSSTSQKDRSYSFDAIVILGANMKKDKKTGRWVLPAVVKEDPGKAVLGFARPIAAKQAFKENLAPMFLVTGGWQFDETGQKTSRAQVLADIMVDKYKIPRRVVKVIGTVGNTLGNVEDTVRYLQVHPKPIKTKRLAILSNDWQLPRAKLFFEAHPYFRKQNIKIEALSVEELLVRSSKSYEDWIKKIYSSPEMIHRLKMEKKGIEDFKLGKYKPLSS